MMKIQIILLVIFLSVFSVLNAQIFTRTWTGAEDNNYDNPNNWDPKGRPGLGEKIIIPQNSPKCIVTSTTFFLAKYPDEIVNSGTIESASGFHLQKFTNTETGIVKMSSGSMRSKEFINSGTFEFDGNNFYINNFKNLDSGKVKITSPITEFKGWEGFGETGVTEFYNTGTITGEGFIKIIGETGTGTNMYIGGSLDAAYSIDIKGFETIEIGVGGKMSAGMSIDIWNSTTNDNDINAVVNGGLLSANGEISISTNVFRNDHSGRIVTANAKPGEEDVKGIKRKITLACNSGYNGGVVKTGDGSSGGGIYIDDISTAKNGHFISEGPIIAGMLTDGGDPSHPDAKVVIFMDTFTNHDVFFLANRETTFTGSYARNNHSIRGLNRTAMSNINKKSHTNSKNAYGELTFNCGSLINNGEIIGFYDNSISEDGSNIEILSEDEIINNGLISTGANAEINVNCNLIQNNGDIYAGYYPDSNGASLIDQFTENSSILGNITIISTTAELNPDLSLMVSKNFKVYSNSLELKNFNNESNLLAENEISFYSSANGSINLTEVANENSILCSSLNIFSNTVHPPTVGLDFICSGTVNENAVDESSIGAGLTVDNITLNPEDEEVYFSFNIQNQSTTQQMISFSVHSFLGWIENVESADIMLEPFQIMGIASLVNIPADVQHGDYDSVSVKLMIDNKIAAESYGLITFDNPQSLFIEIETNVLKEGFVGEFYSDTVKVTQGIPPYFWSIEDTLPGGLDFDGSTGIIYGTPIEAGAFPLTVIVIDSQTDPDTTVHNYLLTINSVTDVKEITLPVEFKLSQNYPNPFNPSTTIAYSIPVVDVLSPAERDKLREGQHVTLIIYDILGNHVATLVNEPQEPGNYRITFNAGSLASGTYLYRLTAGDFTQTKKLLLIK